mmetsp:Transcript_21937/g.45297  ORF Transcript_21937/g.45297 Transcript_21937/m.45297 type:complete len:155 (+) Transcript_21937:753-1217(+)
MTNDFIIFKLSTPVTDSDLLNSIIDLDISGNINLEDGDMLTAIGLGFLDDDYGQDELASKLQEVDLKYLSTWRCRGAWPLLRSSMMCAIDPTPDDLRDQDSCQGTLYMLCILVLHGIGIIVIALCCSPYCSCIPVRTSKSTNKKTFFPTQTFDR